ncbi:hypothetical protein BJF79_34850 [Actinomadura sp. CNU-125]|nr:hypothetical protein BJF79_34850 [Actinomadura sp. CNU-125]
MLDPRVFAELVNHTPSPPTTITIRLATRNLAMPRVAARNPRIRNGIVFAIRCPNPACMNGAVKMSGRSLTFQGSMPNRSNHPFAT